MKKIEKQQENTNTLLELIKANPGLEIVPMVDTECVDSDDFSCWMARWGTAEIEEYWCSDERVYFKGQDFDTLVEDYMEDNYEEYPELTDEELGKVAKEKVNAYAWVKAIVVNIKPY